MPILKDPNFNFIRWRWHALALSIIIIAAGIATIVARGGLPLGIEFSGGTALYVRFQEPTSEDEVRNALAPLNRESVVQQFGPAGDHTLLIRLPLVQGIDEANLGQAAEQVQAALQAANVGAFQIDRREVVGPVIGEDLTRKGIWATVFAIGGILAYIAVRFRFSFAVGAVAATFHDLAVTLVMLTWAGYDLSLNVIAAILTIAGYSVNDTIVIFDRVRENQRAVRREPLEQLVNRSVNQTLSRTIITAGTTFLAVVALFLFGGEVLRGMAFTLIVGVVTGTYSTIFIASAIAIVLSKQPPAATQAQAATAARRKRA